MSAQEVVVLRGALAVPAADGSDLLPFEELRRRIVGGRRAGVFPAPARVQESKVQHGDVT